MIALRSETSGWYKWFLGIVLTALLAGAGWNENKQWETGAEQARAISDIKADLAVIKEAAIIAKETSKENNSKLDKIIDKQDTIIKRQKHE